MKTLKNVVATATYLGEIEKSPYEKEMKKYNNFKYCLADVVGVSTNGASFAYSRVWTNSLLDVEKGRKVKISCSFRSSIATKVKLLK